MSYTYASYWQQRIVEPFSCVLNAYTRLLALSVPDTPAASDAGVISCFTDSLKARFGAKQQPKRKEGRRVWPTTLRFVWAPEFGEIRRKSITKRC